MTPHIEYFRKMRSGDLAIIWQNRQAISATASKEQEHSEATEEGGAGFGDSNR